MVFKSYDCYYSLTKGHRLIDGHIHVSVYKMRWLYNDLACQSYYNKKPVFELQGCLQHGYQ